MEENIAQCALNHYETVLPVTKGKPKEDEWSVYSAIVAQDIDTKRYWVVSCATGTKCSTCTLPTDISEPKALEVKTNILSDCHAEVLARRGLLLSLWEEIRQSRDEKEQSPKCENRLLETINVDKGNDSSRSTLSSSTKQYQYQLRPNIQLYLYISDSPCGDASIYPVFTTSSTSNNSTATNTDDISHQENSNNKIPKTELNFTGAKIIVSDQTGVEATACGGEHQLLVQTSCTTHNTTTNIVVAREDIQLLGKLRTKSGRSNLPSHLRSSCMSCSDKLVRWSVLGLQGALLSRYIPFPIRLSKIVVSQDPRAVSLEAQHEALCRATQRRAVSVLEYLREQQTGNSIPSSWNNMEAAPSVHIVAPTFTRSKSMSDYQCQKDNDEKCNQEANDTTEAGRPSKKQKRQDTLSSSKMSPSGISLNWVQNPSSSSSSSQVEQIIGVRGICQGKKPRTLDDYSRLASRLSRHAFQTLAQQQEHSLQQENPCSHDDDGGKEPSTYSQMKELHCDPNLQQLRSKIFAGGPLAGWLISSPS